MKQVRFHAFRQQTAESAELVILHEQGELVIPLDFGQVRVLASRAVTAAMGWPVREVPHTNSDD